MDSPRLWRAAISKLRSLISCRAPFSSPTGPVHPVWGCTARSLYILLDSVYQLSGEHFLRVQIHQANSPYSTGVGLCARGEGQITLTLQRGANAE